MKRSPRKAGKSVPESESYPKSCLVVSYFMPPSDDTMENKKGCAILFLVCSSGL